MEKDSKEKVSIKGRIFNLMPWQITYFYNYSRIKGRIPNLFRPRDYSEYVFRDNFLGTHKKHAYLADKYAVRDFVEKKGLGESLTKLYGVWDDANKIDFDKLPNQFAIKCNHGCEMNIIVYDKNTLDIRATVKQLNDWLQTKHPVPFESHYRVIKPLIICEELIKTNRDGEFPTDYKIHCAYGKPVFIQCCFKRSKEDVIGKREIYSPDWINMHYTTVQDFRYSEEEMPRPIHLEEMLKDAFILSEDLPYARVDLYDTDERVIFGEITLSPQGGWLSYFTQEARDVMGDAIRNGKKARKK